MRAKVSAYSLTRADITSSHTHPDNNHHDLDRTRYKHRTSFSLCEYVLDYMHFRCSISYLGNDRRSCLCAGMQERLRSMTPPEPLKA